MSTTESRLKKPRRKYPKRPYNPNQGTVSALLSDELRARLQRSVQIVNALGVEVTRSDVIRKSLNDLLDRFDAAVLEEELALAQGEGEGEGEGEEDHYDTEEVELK